VTSAITHEPVTVLVESIETREGQKFISIRTLEGEYGSARDFEASLDYTIGRWERGDISTRKEVKLWTLLSFILPEARGSSHGGGLRWSLLGAADATAFSPPRRA